MYDSIIHNEATKIRSIASTERMSHQVTWIATSKLDFYIQAF